MNHSNARRSYLSTILVCALSLFAPCTMACDCVSQTVEEGLEGSDLVFLGAVTSASVRSKGQTGEDVTIEFDVIYLKKGTIKQVPKTLRTPSWSGNCGMKISVPEMYWFFTDSQGHFDSCSATRTAMDEGAGALSEETYKALVKRKRAEINTIKE